MTVYEYAYETDGPIHLTIEDEFVWGDLGHTLCGKSLEGMPFGDETLSGIAATCRQCKALVDHQRRFPGTPAPDQVPFTIPDSLGNRERVEGCDLCAQCGCKYWENDVCVDCGGTTITLPGGD